MYKQTLVDTRSGLNKYEILKPRPDSVTEALLMDAANQLLKEAGDEPDDRFAVPTLELYAKISDAFNRKGSGAICFILRMMKDCVFN